MRTVHFRLKITYYIQTKWLKNHQKLKDWAILLQTDKTDVVRLMQRRPKTGLKVFESRLQQNLPIAEFQYSDDRLHPYLNVQTRTHRALKP